MGASIERAQKNSLTNQRVFEYKLFSDWVNRNLFLIATFAFEAYYAFNFSEQSIVSTTSNVHTWVDVSTALTVKDRSTCYSLSISCFSSKTFCL